VSAIEIYHTEENFGGKKLWRMNRVGEKKTLANGPCCMQIWRKKLPRTGQSLQEKTVALLPACISDQ